MSPLAALPILRGRALHVRPLAYALARLTPGILDDPSPAARDAASDILDDLLHEYEQEQQRGVCPHCGTPVIQVTGLLTGGTFVVDAAPDPAGEYAVWRVAGRAYARVPSDRRPLRPGEKRHRSHADTCAAGQTPYTGPNAELYAVLGVRPGAPLAEVRRAFRRLARELHPDLNPDTPGERFAEVTRAYDLLTGRSEVAA